MLERVSRHKKHSHEVFYVSRGRLQAWSRVIAQVSKWLGEITRARWAGTGGPVGRDGTPSPTRTRDPASGGSQSGRSASGAGRLTN